MGNLQTLGPSPNKLVENGRTNTYVCLPILHGPVPPADKIFKRKLQIQLPLIVTIV